MNKPKCFMELCAGTAALSVRLVGGKDAKPPVSRMGAKTGYADVILSVLGLYPGLGAESFVWCEPDDGVRGLLMAYCQPSVLKEAAAILRGWKDEEPRALWERLRAELKAGAAAEGADGVARFCTVTAWTNNGGNMYAGPDRPSSCHPPGWTAAITASGLASRIADLPPLPPTLIARDGRAVTPEEVARFAFVSARTMPQSAGRGEIGAGDFLQRMKADGTQRYPADHPADVLYGMPPFPPTFIARDGRAVTPEEVARYILVIGQTWPHKMDGRPMSQWAQKTKDDGGVCIATLIEQTQSLPVWPPVTITDDARTLTPPKLPEGVIVYCDPPYLKTTGYKHDLSREEVVRLARLWSDAGATVCISEQTTIPELIADGWHGVQISFARKGQKRTFSEQQDEYLTLNVKPSFIPREPEPMFDDLKVVKKPKVKVVRVSQPTEPQPINQPVQTLNLFGGNND